MINSQYDLLPEWELVSKGLFGKETWGRCLASDPETVILMVVSRGDSHSWEVSPPGEEWMELAYAEGKSESFENAKNAAQDSYAELLEKLANDREDIYIHSFSFNEDNADGSELLLTTRFHIRNGKIEYTQELSLEAGPNSASIHLGSIQITPEKLRDLANELKNVKAETLSSI